MSRLLTLLFDQSLWHKDINSLKSSSSLAPPVLRPPTPSHRSIALIVLYSIDCKQQLRCFLPLQLAPLGLWSPWLLAAFGMLAGSVLLACARTTNTSGTLSLPPSAPSPPGQLAMACRVIPSTNGVCLPSISRRLPLMACSKFNCTGCVQTCCHEASPLDSFTYKMTRYGEL